MTNHLSESTKDLLLELYNRVWGGGKLLQSQKEAVVVPIGKPRKDDKNPGNYRPIALISNVCKINVQLIRQIQCYFYKEKSW